MEQKIETSEKIPEHHHIKSAYKQELKRSMSFLMSFTMGITNIAVIPALFLQMELGFLAGGPVVMIWGWVFVAILTICVGRSLAEICSTYPAEGSVYYWSGVLANRRYGPICSYMCGWLNLLGNIACAVTFAYGLASVLVGFQTLGTTATGNTWGEGAVVALSILIIAIWSVKNLMGIEEQGLFADVSGIFQIVSGVAIVFAIFAFSPQLSSTEFVFTHFNNQTGFTSIPYVCMIGLLSSLYCFTGYEASATLGEETKSPNETAPKSVVYSIITSAIVGFIVLLGILYGCQENINFVVHGPSSSAMNLFLLVSNNGIAGAVILSIVLFCNAMVSGFTGMTISSRIMYAMCRDGAIPASKTIGYLDPVTRSPNRIIVLIFFIEALLCLLPLVSSTAFSAFTQISTIATYLSYAIPIFLRVTSSRDLFQQDSYNLGKWSIINGWISFIFLVLMSIILILPTETDPVNGLTLANFNYTPVVLAIVLLIAFIYWNLPAPFGAKHFFEGPKMAGIDSEEEGNSLLRSSLFSEEINEDKQKLSAIN